MRRHLDPDSFYINVKIYRNYPAIQQLCRLPYIHQRYKSQYGQSMDGFELPQFYYNTIGIIFLSQIFILLAIVVDGTQGSDCCGSR